MHPYTTDTSPEAEIVQMELIRNMHPEQRALKSMRMTTRLVRECKAAIRRNHPEFTQRQVGLEFIAINYGKVLSEEVREYLQKQDDGNG